MILENIFKDFRAVNLSEYLKTLPEDTEIWINNLHYDIISEYVKTRVDKKYQPATFYNGVALYEGELDFTDFNVNLVEFYSFEKETAWIKTFLLRLDANVSRLYEDDSAPHLAANLKDVFNILDPIKFNQETPRVAKDKGMMVSQNFADKSNIRGYSGVSVTEHEKFEDYDQFLEFYEKEKETKGLGKYFAAGQGLFSGE